MPWLRQPKLLGPAGTSLCLDLAWCRSAHEQEGPGSVCVNPGSENERRRRNVCHRIGSCQPAAAALPRQWYL